MVIATPAPRPHGVDQRPGPDHGRTDLRVDAAGSGFDHAAADLHVGIDHDLDRGVDDEGLELLGRDDIAGMEADDEVLAVRHEGQSPLHGLDADRRAQTDLAPEKRLGQLEGELDGFVLCLGQRRFAQRRGPSAAAAIEGIAQTGRLFSARRIVGRPPPRPGRPVSLLVGGGSFGRERVDDRGLLVPDHIGVARVEGLGRRRGDRPLPAAPG